MENVALCMIWSFFRRAPGGPPIFFPCRRLTFFTTSLLGCKDSALLYRFDPIGTANILVPNTCKYRFGALLVTFSNLCAMYLQTKVNVITKRSKSRNAPHTGFRSSSLVYPIIDLNKKSVGVSDIIASFVVLCHFEGKMQHRQNQGNTNYEVGWFAWRSIKSIPKKQQWHVSRHLKSLEQFFQCFI